MTVASSCSVHTRRAGEKGDTVTGAQRTVRQCIPVAKTLHDPPTDLPSLQAEAAERLVMAAAHVALELLHRRCQVLRLPPPIASPASPPSAGPSPTATATTTTSSSPS